jgi:hypothetical protein
MTGGQALRPSQFIYTFGVGSIIEAPGGPRLVPEFAKWGKVFGAGRSPSVSEFAIPDTTVSSLLDDGLIFRIPTNVDLSQPENVQIFRTERFPEWALCAKHGFLFELSADDRTKCPDCVISGFTTRSARPEAIRFVRACPDGHLDDVDWYGIIHSSKKTCTSTIYRWDSQGGSLRDVEISCTCGARKTLQDVYRETKHCTGRFPERGGTYSSCSMEAKVTLRGSSSLRIPEVITTITIPQFASRLHRILDGLQMRTILATRNTWTKAELLKALETMATVDPTLLDPRTIDEINSQSEERLLKVIDDLRRYGRNRPTTLQAIREAEFNALQDAAENGHPPDPTSENPEFQVNKFKVRKDVHFQSRTYRIAPIERLRVVTVQKGYRRLGTDPEQNRLVNTFYFDGNRKWYPGLEQIGEGIFIDLSASKPTFDSPEWEAEYNNHMMNLQFHPVFVWWHSLSHRIIGALSVDSGYSSAAIRESVYTVRDPVTNEVSGGILLYTAQSGSDGSLGGLISLVPDFENVLSAATRNLDACSNDPLCSEMSVKTRGNNGAACYACLLLSETSCSNRNMFLDRNLLRSSV